jgi:hypothetical protein
MVFFKLAAGNDYSQQITSSWGQQYHHGSLDKRHSKVSTHLHSTTNQKKDMLVFMGNGLANCREQATVFVRYVLISIFYLLPPHIRYSSPHFYIPWKWISFLVIENMSVASNACRAWNIHVYCILVCCLVIESFPQSIKNALKSTSHL